MLVPMNSSSTPFALFQDIPAATETVLDDLERRTKARMAEVCYGRKPSIGSR